MKTTSEIMPVSEVFVMELAPSTAKWMPNRSWKLWTTNSTSVRLSAVIYIET